VFNIPRAISERRKRRVHLYSALVAATAILFLIPSARAQQSIIVSPQVTQIEMTPGARKAFEVAVGNASETSPIVVHLGVASIAQNDRGNYIVIKGDNEWSCASWITLDQNTITLAPGDVVPVRGIIQAPFTAGGGRYAAVTVAFGDAGRGTAPLSASFEYMLASYLEVTMTTGLARRSMDISNLKIVPVSGNRALEDKYGNQAFFVTADVKNSGNIGVVAEATLRIRQEKGLLQREVPLGTGRGMVLPGAVVKYRSLFTEAPPSGVYSAEATLQYGGYKPSITRMVFSVTPEGDITPGRVESVETVGLGITPSKFDLRAGPGSRKTVGVTIHNVEDYPVKIAALRLPLSQLPDGRLLANEDEEIASCADWIVIEPDTFDVEPDTRKRLRVTIRVPQDAQGSAYSRLVFMPLDTEVSTRTMEESYTTDIYLSLVPDIVEGIEIEEFDVESEGRFKPVACIFKVKNTGNNYVDIEAEAQINSTQGPAVKEVRLEGRNTRILPGVTRTFSIVDQQGLESGAYNVELTIRTGRKRAAFEARTFSI
jgi:hypothetical protein